MSDQPKLTAVEAIAEMRKAADQTLTPRGFEMEAVKILDRTEEPDEHGRPAGKDKTISKLRRKVDQQKETLDSLHTRCASLKSSNRNKASQVARLKKELDELRPLTVEEARKRKLCQVCKKPGMYYPHHLQDYGDEYRHSACKTELPAIDRAEPGAVCSNDAGDTAAPLGDVGEASPLSPAEADDHLPTLLDAKGALPPAADRDDIWSEPLAPVEPLNWPTYAGCWDRRGDKYFVNHKLQIWFDDEWHDSFECATLPLRGGWVRCTVTAPPVKEPEPIPEKPLRLFAYDGISWQWYFQKSYDRYVYEHYPSGAPYRLKYFTEINESASDPEAVKLWRDSRREKE